MAGIYGNLESPKPNELFYFDSFEVKGWVFSKNSKIRHVEIEINTKKYYTLTHIRREDVIKDYFIHKEKCKYCGFNQNIKFPIQMAKEPIIIIVTAVAEDGELYQLGKFTIFHKSLEPYNHRCLRNSILYNSVSKDLKKYNPLVSILIPAYNRTNFLEIALNSALNQTYRNLEVIICDDSNNNQVETIVKKKYLNKYKNLKYLKNEKNLGQFKNDLKLLELANGEYINFLMDDDVFERDKIETMMRYYIHDIREEIKLVTSRRQTINEHGEIVCHSSNISKLLFNKDTVIDGIEFGNIILKDIVNYIGEPTTVLFRKKDLIEPFGVFNGREYGCNVDKATWYNLLSQGKAVYISKTLSYFRIHDGQQLNNERIRLLGIVDYAHEVLTAPQKGFMQNKDEYRELISNCLSWISNSINTLDYKYVDDINYKELMDYCDTLKIKMNRYKFK